MRIRQITWFTDNEILVDRSTPVLHNGPYRWYKATRSTMKRIERLFEAHRENLIFNLSNTIDQGIALEVR